jgi:hypothetical protein
MRKNVKRSSGGARWSLKRAAVCRSGCPIIDLPSCGSRSYFCRYSAPLSHRISAYQSYDSGLRTKCEVPGQAVANSKMFDERQLAAWAPFENFEVFSKCRPNGIASRRYGAEAPSEPTPWTPRGKRLAPAPEFLEISGASDRPQRPEALLLPLWPHAASSWHGPGLHRR